MAHNGLGSVTNTVQIDIPKRLESKFVTRGQFKYMIQFIASSERCGTSHTETRQYDVFFLGHRAGCPPVLGAVAR